MEPVYVLDAVEDLLEELAGFLLLEPLSLHDLVEEFTPTSLLDEEEEFVVILNDLLELDDVRVTQELQDVDLTGHTFHVCYLADLALL